MVTSVLLFGSKVKLLGENRIQSAQDLSRLPGGRICKFPSGILNQSTTFKNTLTSSLPVFVTVKTLVLVVPGVISNMKESGFTASLAELGFKAINKEANAKAQIRETLFLPLIVLVEKVGRLFNGPLSGRG